MVFGDHNDIAADTASAALGPQTVLGYYLQTLRVAAQTRHDTARRAAQLVTQNGA